jgi:hypothetical protein
MSLGSLSAKTSVLPVKDTLSPAVRVRYFGRLLADRACALYVSRRVKLTSLAALGNVYAFRNRYAL